MLNVKELFVISLLSASGLFYNMTFAEDAKAQVIEKAKSDLKAAFDSIPAESYGRIKDQSVATITSICSIPVQLDLQKSSKAFSAKFSPLFNNLSACAQKALDQALLAIQKDVAGEELPVNAKISRLLEHSYFNKIKERLVNFMFQVTPELKIIKKQDIDRQINLALAGFMQKNLSDGDITNLTKFFQDFFQSKGFKKIEENADRFMQIIADNLPPVVAAKVKQAWCDAKQIS